MDSFNTLWCLFGAIIIDLYAGGWFRAGNSLWHPKNLLIRLVEKLGEKLDRKARSSTTLLIRGALSLFCTFGVVSLAGMAIHWTLVEIPLGWVLELAILTSLVSVGKSWGLGTVLASSLESGSREDARRHLGAFSSRDATYSDSDEIIRLGIESAIVNFISDFMGPVLFYVVLGLPGVFMYHALKLSSSSGASPDYLIFSKRLLTVVDGLLSWLGAVSLFCAILLFSETSPRRVLVEGRALFAVDRGIHFGPAKTVVAEALGITLEGPRRYLSGQIERPYVGSGAAPTPKDLVQTVKIALVAAGLTATVIFVCAVAV